MDFFTLKYSHEMLLGDEEPSKYVRQIDGQVLAWVGDERKVPAGKFSVAVVNAELVVDERDSIDYAMDVSQSTLPYRELYDRHLGFRPAVDRAIDGDEWWAPNMLILQRLQLLPRFRGRSQGLHVLRGLCMHFGIGCGLFAMKPFPLQFECKSTREEDAAEFDEYGFGRMSGDFRRSVAKLRAHYGRLGFVRVPRTKFMVANGRKPLPAIKD